MAGKSEDETAISCIHSGVHGFWFFRHICHSHCRFFGRRKIFFFLKLTCSLGTVEPMGCLGTVHMYATNMLESVPGLLKTRHPGLLQRTRRPKRGRRPFITKKNPKMHFDER